MRGETIEDYLHRYERTCATIIAYSLGYATPHCAASILKDAHERQPNYCEWIDACYHADPLPAVRAAIASRHHLKGYLAEYEQALALVRRTNQGGDPPHFASWC